MRVIILRFCLARTKNECTKKKMKMMKKKMKMMMNIMKMRLDSYSFLSTLFDPFGGFKMSILVGNIVALLSIKRTSAHKH